MSRTKMSGSQREHSQTMVGGVPYGICAMVLSTLLISGLAFGQQPPAGGFQAGGPPPGSSPPAGAPTGGPGGGGTSISSDPKLLSALPPASKEVLKQYPPSPDPHNLAGVWVAEPKPFGGMPQFPLTDAAKQHMAKQMQRQRAADAQGKVLLSQAGRCRPMEGIGIGSELFPAEIVQTPDTIIILNEEGRGRWTIRLNGKHPQQVKHTYFGDSVGHWEGDTLVVDTVGLRSSEGAFGAGMRSEQARIVSRLRKSEGGATLELTSTIYDSETYTQPVEIGKTVSHWHPELGLLEFQCEENIEGAREGMVE